MDLTEMQEKAESATYLGGETQEVADLVLELVAEVRTLRSQNDLLTHDLGVIRRAYRINGQARENLRKTLNKIQNRQ